MTATCHALGGARHRCAGLPPRLYQRTRHGVPTGDVYSLCERGVEEWQAEAIEHGEPELGLEPGEEER